MLSALQRFLPNRTALAALGGLAWALSFGAVRDFVWADLREGMMSTAGLSRTVRALVWAGFGLLAAMIGALLFNDLWRALSPLIPLSAVSSSNIGRGALLPLALLPATMFLVALAWSFMLAGALHSHPALRAVALLLYLPYALQWVGVGASPLAGSLVYTLVAVAAVLGVPLLFAVRWRAAARPGLEFALLLALVTLACAIGQARATALWRLTQTPLVLATMELTVGQLQALVMPMLFLIGLDIAGFTRRAAGWSVQIVAARLPRWAPWLLLGVGLALRLADVSREAGELVRRPEDLGMFAGALLGLLALAVVWLAVARLIPAGIAAAAPEGTAAAAERWALPLILAFHAIAVVSPIPALALLIVAELSDDASLVATAMRALDGYNPAALIDVWHVGLYLVALAGCVWLARRGRACPALYLGAFGAYNLWLKVTEPGGPLGGLAQRGNEPEDFWLVLAIAIAALVALLRRMLSAQRAVELLFLLLITGLLRQTDFIENPFSPLLGFAGIGFIAFGLVWDAMTRGAWANADTPGLPRTSRVLLYIGYVLLTVTLVNWALTSHSLLYVGQFTGDAAVNGLDRFGRPLLYAIFLMTLAGQGERTAEE
jgi:hypothetical protein